MGRAGDRAPDGRRVANRGMSSVRAGSRRDGPLMPRWMRCVAYTIAAGVWFSGVAWLTLHYFDRVQGPFGFGPSPWEPWALGVHGAFAFAAIWWFGWLSAAHLAPGWSSGSQRGTGLALALFFGALILSGYLLYYLGGQRSRDWVSVLHWILGVVALIVFALHRLWRQHLTAR